MLSLFMFGCFNLIYAMEFRHGIRYPLSATAIFLLILGQRFLSLGPIAKTRRRGITANLPASGSLIVSLLLLVRMWMMFYYQKPAVQKKENITIVYILY